MHKMDNCPHNAWTENAYKFQLKNLYKIVIRCKYFAKNKFKKKTFFKNTIFCIK